VNSTIQKSRKRAVGQSSKRGVKSSSTVQQPASKRGKKSKPQEDKENDVTGKQKQRRALNKKEVSNVMDAVEKINSTSCAIIVCSAVKQQVPAHSNALKELANSLIPGDTVFLFEHLQKTFVELYKSCSTMKDKYLSF